MTTIEDLILGMLKIGDLVLVDGIWPGEVVDIAHCESGATLFQIASPKGIWRNHRPEWLEYDAERVVFVEFNDVAHLFDTYVERVQQMERDLAEMRARWASA